MNSSNFPFAIFYLFHLQLFCDQRSRIISKKGRVQVKYPTQKIIGHHIRRGIYCYSRPLKCLLGGLVDESYRISPYHLPNHLNIMFQ